MLARTTGGAGPTNRSYWFNTLWNCNDGETGDGQVSGFAAAQDPVIYYQVLASMICCAWSFWAQDPAIYYQVLADVFEKAELT